MQYKKIPEHHTGVFQYGGIALAVVCILLLTSTLVVVGSAKSIDQFYQIEKFNRKKQELRLEVKKKMKDVVESLRTLTPEETEKTLSTVDETLTINQTALAGENHQLVSLFDITLRKGKLNFSVLTIRYPALLQRLSDHQINQASADITQTLFNREWFEISPNYFADISVNADCSDLPISTVYWINGDCAIEKHAVSHGSASSPILLIVKNGDFRLRSDAEFYGLILAINNGETHEFRIDNAATLKGAYTSFDTLTERIDGDLLYSEEILLSLQHHPNLAKTMIVPSSWIQQ